MAVASNYGEWIILCSLTHLLWSTEDLLNLLVWKSGLFTVFQKLNQIRATHVSSEEKNPWSLLRNRRESLNLSFLTWANFGHKSKASLNALAPLELPWPWHLLAQPLLAAGSCCPQAWSREGSSCISWQGRQHLALLPFGPQPGQRLKWDFSKMMNCPDLFSLNLLILVPYCRIFQKYVYLFFASHVHF